MQRRCDVENVKATMPAGYGMACGQFIGAAKYVLKIAGHKHGDTVCKI